MPLTQLIPYFEGIQYDGENSAEVLAAVPDYYVNESTPSIPAGIVSEEDGVLVLGMTPPPGYDGPIERSLAVGDWLVLVPETLSTGLISGVIVCTAADPVDRYYIPRSEVAS